MTDWLEQLIGKSPLAWQEGWWAAANGGMWSICLAAKQGRLALAEQDILQQLLERLSERLPALQYLLRQEGLVKEQADAILQRAQRMIQWAVGDNEVPILDRVAFEQPRREIWLQGLGVTRANTGFVVRITLQRWDHPAGVPAEYRDSWSYLQPHPASCLMPADSSFLATLGIVRQWCQRFALAQSFVMWNIEQSDGTLRGFQGDSLGAAITLGLHHLLDETLPPLDPSITISAAVSDEGRFHPVSGLKAKVHVGRFRASPPLRHLLVASNQDLSEINPSDGLFDFVVPTATLNEAIEFFQVQARPFEAVRQQAIQQTRHLLAIGIKPVEWTVYQEPQVCGLNPQTGQEGEGTRLSECVYRTFEETNEGICLITAPSGGGKSSALSYLAHQIVGGQALPVLLSADQWESCWQANPHFDLPAILHHLYQSLANAPSIEHWRQWLQQGRAVLLVDKLESVAPNQSFRDHLRQVLQTFPLLRAVFAVRVEWLSWFEALALPIYRLLPLSEAQTHALVHSLEDLLGRSTPHATSFAGNPFLCTAACFIDGTPPTGQGRFLQQLFEVLLRQAGDIGLPIFRAIGLITEAMERLPEDIAWDEECFVAALENVAGSEAGVLWKACIHPNVRLLSQQGGKVVWAHTLLAEFLRAKALAEFWKQRSRDVQLRLNQTPPRTILLASLLPAEEGPGLWNWLGQQADTSPRRWAEVAALCLGERDDAPASLAQQIVQGWLRAFRSGVPEVHWDRAIQATTRAFSSVTFAQALTLLDSSSSSDQRAGGAILRLVGQVTALPANLIETLVQTAMKDRYGSLNRDVVAVFAGDAQQHHQPLVFQKLIDALSAHDAGVRHNAVEILADLGHLATPQRHDEITSRLRHIVQQDPASSVRRAAI